MVLFLLREFKYFYCNKQLYGQRWAAAGCIGCTAGLFRPMLRGRAGVSTSAERWGWLPGRPPSL
jgi:hypothetical protein